MKKENKAILEMLMCAALWSIAGIFIKLIPWNSFVISALRSFFAGLTVLAYIRIKGYRISINRRTIVAGLLLGLVYIAFVAANKLRRKRDSPAIYRPYIHRHFLGAVFRPAL